MKSRERNNLILKTLEEIRDAIKLIAPQPVKEDPQQEAKQQLLLETLHDSTTSLEKAVKDNLS